MSPDQCRINSKPVLKKDIVSLENADRLTLRQLIFEETNERESERANEQTNLHKHNWSLTAQD